MLYANRLNSSVEDIASAIGYMATCTLIEWYGGKKLFIPKHFDPNHEIARIIGACPYRHLVAQYGDTLVTVPTDHFRELIRQDRIVASLLGIGHGTKLIAGMVGLTERQVQNIRRRLECAGVLDVEPRRCP